MVRYIASWLKLLIGLLVTIVILNSILTSIYDNDNGHAIRKRKLYVITPTYDRLVQKAELTRLSNTFMLVPNMNWIIVEDSANRSELTKKFINENRLLLQRLDSVTHLHTQTPSKFKLKPGDPSWKFPKGVWQRNKALDWLRSNVESLDIDGIVYFADDDNTYDIQVFEEMRSTRLVSVWPVAFSGGLLVERPIVDRKTNKVTSFNAMWQPQRAFPIDMAGFAVSLRLLVAKSGVYFSPESSVGYQESDFIKKLVHMDELEPRADSCTKVFVWHTKTAKPNLHQEGKLTVSSRDGVKW